MYTVTSKGQLRFLTSSQGQKVTQVGHFAYHLMRLDKGNILNLPQLSISFQSKVISKIVHWPHDVIIWPQMTFTGVTYAKLHRGHQQ